jgi:SAM-dependent methyltransferase
MRIASPITGSDNTEKIQDFDTGQIISDYQRNYKIDVSSYFSGLEKIELYRCCDTGYRFFIPLITVGDEKLYQQLQKLPWYYQKDKWEHRQAGDYIGRKQTVLDVGCGSGEFLELAQSKGAITLGIELNPGAVQVCQKKGLNVCLQTIGEHRKKNNKAYDIICAFQVLEHLTTPAVFIKEALSLLKTGGSLIVSVPNNDSLIYKNHFDAGLNLPPHHMGLWDSASLISLQKFFPLRIEALKWDPLSLEGTLMLKDYFYKVSTAPASPLNKVFYRAALALIERGLRDLSDYLPGHSLLAVYTKIN